MGAHWTGILIVVVLLVLLFGGRGKREPMARYIAFCQMPWTATQKGAIVRLSAGLRACRPTCILEK